MRTLEDVLDKHASTEDVTSLPGDLINAYLYRSYLPRYNSMIDRILSMREANKTQAQKILKTSNERRYIRRSITHISEVNACVDLILKRSLNKDHIIRAKELKKDMDALLLKAEERITSKNLITSTTPLNKRGTGKKNKISHMIPKFLRKIFSK